MKRKPENQTAAKNADVARWAGIRFALVVFDIIAVNFSYCITLLIRYYVNYQLMDTADVYLAAFRQFAPYYTLCCLIVFGCFKLYSGLWQYAGLNDMNRVIAANAVTAVIYLAGTLIFVRKMPITYYLLGAAIQFVLIAASRFSYRLITAETTKLRRGRLSTTINVMIVGVGETARIVRKKIENDHNNAAHPVCIFSHKGTNGKAMLDGLPVLSGMENLRDYLLKYHVECVILADAMMPQEIRKQIKGLCAELELGVQDFSGYIQREGNGLTFKALMEYTDGIVTVADGTQTQVFANGEEALVALGGMFDVHSVTAQEGKLLVKVTAHPQVLNNVNAAWVREFERETGESVSFF